MSHAPSPAAASPSPVAAAATGQNTELDVVQEVRFAVVMYGGVSLAIYINGVTQELLHLVRATGYADGSRPQAGAHLSSALLPIERVYRKLAYLAGDETLRLNYQQCLEHGAPDDAEVNALLVGNRPLATRFIIDILSGTSAGGINAIFLAKALSNDKQLGDLTKLWIKEGDLGSLINDRRSVKDLRSVQHVDPPRSLLNSQRMYCKLLEALKAVDESTGYSAPAGLALPVGSPKSPSPYVDELDLYVTTTDIHGVPLPIRLADRVVHERRHRNVYQLRYSSGTRGKFHNDFHAENSPFLAFAARCTSSFPFAFEPMCLADMDPIVPALGYGPGWDKREWQDYLTNYLGSRSANGAGEIKKRSFGDGGYLDNKPFTYVTETLSRRYSDVPVRRKLLYIEPSPEHPEDQPASLTRPSALENVFAALLDLPRQETIREDLQRLLDRNHLIERADRTLNQVRNDVAIAKQDFETQPRTFWKDEYLPDTIKRFSTSYLPYRRMRIADTTDEIARCFTSQAGFAVDSDEFRAIRAIVYVWRDQNYGDYREEKKPASVNAFLNDFDLGFRVRRMNFIRRQLDQLHAMADLPSEKLETDGKPDEIQTAYRRLQQQGLTYDVSQRDTFKKQLRSLKKDLNAVERDLQAVRAALQTGTQPGAITTSERPLLGDKLMGLGIQDVHLKYVLGMEWSTEEEPDAKAGAEPQVPKAETRFQRSTSIDACNARARELVEQPERFHLPIDCQGRYSDVAGSLKHYLTEAFDKAYEGCKHLLANSPNDPLRSYLWHEFLAFEDYDQVTFPILYGTNVGEAEPVAILRISPEDAVALIDERKDPARRRKLAGISLFNFGGFLDRSWRENDILWGRLDGAERLIMSVLPDPEDVLVRADLIREAHLAILADWAEAAKTQSLGDIIARTMMRAGAPSAVERRIMPPNQRIDTEKRIAAAVTGMMSPPELLEFMRGTYQVDRRLDAEPLLGSISRATQVIGKMFEDIASRHSQQGKHLGWIARFGSIFWGLVQVAIPGSMKNLLFFHWFKVLLVFEAVILAGGWLFNEGPAVRFGWLSLLFTVLVGLTVAVLKDLMSLRRRYIRLASAALVLAALFFLVAGVDRVFDLGWGFGLAARWDQLTALWRP
jgi:patatin-related protein